MPKLKIYADTNIYSRPFDNLNLLDIKLESEACLSIFKLSLLNKIILYSSDILKLEIVRAPADKKIQLYKNISLCHKNIAQTDQVKARAKKLMAWYKIQARDALHAASAISAKVDIFLTCDYDLIKRLQDCKQIKTVNPVNFILLYAYSFKNN
ncbi:MAG: PIN domain-containing protein [Patescibacteria group bacterium]|mgnify:CR=1 FL=1